MTVIKYITQVPFAFGAIRPARAECERFGPPPGLSRMGSGRETYDDAANAMLGHHCHGTRPRVATREDNLRLLEASA
ncbi:MAG: hypothetical protein ACM3PU_05825 [Gemmatimonadota bacterium]